MRLAMLFVALAACSTTTPSTSNGELKSVANSGGGLIPCTASTPWCAFDVTYSGSDLTVASRTTTMKAKGVLTPAAAAELDNLIATLPLSTTDGEHQGCADAPIITFTIDFDSVGERVFQRACEFDNLTALHGFVNNVHGALVPTCIGNTRVACAQP